MPDQEGPSLTINVSCFNCKYSKTESYTCQGDSETEYYCSHPKVEETTTGIFNVPVRYCGCVSKTPKWCPLYPNLDNFGTLK